MRYFRHTVSMTEWQWDGIHMVLIKPNGRSTFVSPAELLKCPGVIEVDEDGRTLNRWPGISAPRFFRETTTGAEWEFRNGIMTLRDTGEESLFVSPAELLKCLDVIEVDEDGEPLKLTPSEAAEIRGESLQQAEADES